MDSKLQNNESKISRFLPKGVLYNIMIYKDIEETITRKLTLNNQRRGRKRMKILMGWGMSDNSEHFIPIPQIHAQKGTGTNRICSDAHWVSFHMFPILAQVRFSKVLDNLENTF